MESWRPCPVGTCSGFRARRSTRSGSSSSSTRAVGCWPTGRGKTPRRPSVQALELWRGPPLADLQYEPLAQNEIRRLEELRLIATEHRLEADLALGRHAEAVPELEALVREHPLREGLRRMLMLALYRSGRQADALAAYQHAREKLVDEHGLDPDEPLRRLEKAILVHDPELDFVAPIASSVPAPELRGAVACRRRREDAGSPEGRHGDLRGRRRLRRVRGVDRSRGDARGAHRLLRAHEGRRRAPRGGCREAEVHRRGRDGRVRTARDARGRRRTRPAERRSRCEAPVVELGIECRIGIETGEVAVQTPELLVTGRAVTTAARLRAARRQPGEILLGSGTMELVARRCDRSSRSSAEEEGRSGPGLAPRVRSSTSRTRAPVRLAVRRTRSGSWRRCARRGTACVRDQSLRAP